MRNIPAALQAHLEQPVTTTCRLLRFDLRNGESHGLTTLDRDVVYQGVTYSAINGFDSNVIASDTSYSVDNSEAYALLSADIPGITIDMARRGALDDAAWEMLLVNYEDLSMGHVLLDAGDVGEVKVVKETIFMPELLSYAMRLRNTIGGVDSRTCRAVFGTPAAGHTGCGVDAEPLWVNGTVDALGAEPGRIFTSSAFTGAGSLVPGRVQWLGGNNVSERLYQIEVFETDTVMLFEPLPFDIEVGDTFRFRPDCDKRFATCRDVWNNMLDFKGEPLIPTNDGSAAQTPGATV